MSSLNPSLDSVRPCVCLWLIDYATSHVWVYVSDDWPVVPHYEVYHLHDGFHIGNYYWSNKDDLKVNP